MNSVYVASAPEILPSTAISADAHVAIMVPVERAVLAGESRGLVRLALLELVLEAWKANWDGHGARPVSARTYALALDFVEALPDYAMEPDVAAEPSGEIVFSWHPPAGNVFAVSISATGRLSYAGLFGAKQIHGAEVFVDRLPKAISENLARILRSTISLAR